jgi:dynein heavy chain, axonemal
MKQLPGEAKRFKSVDKSWKEIIRGTQAQPNTLETCCRDGKVLLARLEQMNTDLDRVQKGLKEYLEAKRTVFARFYFLSNDDLLEILSQTKDVEKVQSHLRKVFENMTELQFQPDKTITGMYSGEKEFIPTSGTLDPKDKKVEDWMGEVENMMFTTVRDVLDYSIKDYLELDRNAWIKKHPGQCVLNGSQVHWTQEVEQAILKNGVKGAQEVLAMLDAQLLNTVALVRERLSKLQSLTLGALIVIDVHAKDVVRKLVDDKVDDINHFNWISQLRYYWPKDEDNCFVRCIQTNFPYGYEYLGNSQRLVITPLTDKCYMTLMGALKLDLGGAPAGPAGTGKTESTKDLAKALAKQCVVFNCSPTMEITMITSFFKGLAASGSWICFDEFNRINIEVLSVIAQQLLQLFGEKAKGSREVVFEESQIKMKPTFCVFITMNPGYAGRTELPDNLKALFRPVAMMVPDYGLIGEIMLYSFGFIKASILANKMVTTFTLCSEQLSSQDHYDYGMRAVRSVINAAGLLKMSPLTAALNED